MPAPDLSGFKVAASELSSSTKFNNLVQAIQDEFSDVDADQIPGYPSDPSKFLRGDGSWATAVQIATTVAGLGTPQGGMVGALRLGASPYDLIGLVYDATIGKFVSPPFLLSAFVVAATTASTTYAQPSGGTVINTAQMSNFKRIYDAGLRPQVRIGTVLSVSAGTPNVRVGLGIDEYASGDGSTTELGTVEGAAFDSGDFVAATTNKFFATDWLSASMNAPTKANVDFSVQARTASGTLTLLRTTYEMRWISA